MKQTLPGTRTGLAATGISHCTSFSIFFATSFLLTFFGTGSCFADDLVISGRVTYHAYTASGKDFFLSTNDFTCRISTSEKSRWKLRIWGTPGEKSSFARTRQYYEVGPGDEGIFSLMRTKDEVVAQTMAKYTNRGSSSKIPSPAQGAAEILTSMVPFCEHGPYPTPIWFAYTSSDYLRASNSNLLHAIWPIPRGLHRQNSYLLACDIDLASDKPSLPRRVVFHNSGKWPESGSDGSFLRFTPYQPPFDKGFTNAIYEAQSFTNFEGFYLPESFSLTQFRPKPNGAKPQDLTVSAQWNGRTMSISKESSEDDYRPKLADKITVVQDYRVSDPLVSSLTYSTTNGQWLSTNSPMFKRVFGMQKAKAKRLPVASRKTRVIQQTWVVAMLISFLCIGLYAWKGGNNKTKENA